MSQKYLNVMKNGRKLGGGAAQLSYIKSHGGWDKYHEYLSRKITNIATNIAITEITAEQSQPKLKVL